VEYFTRGSLSGCIVSRYNCLLWKPQRLERFCRSSLRVNQQRGLGANCFCSRLQAFLYIHGLNLALNPQEQGLNQIDGLISIDRVVVDRRLTQKSHGSSRRAGIPQKMFLTSIENGYQPGLNSWRSQNFRLQFKLPDSSALVNLKSTDQVLGLAGADVAVECQEYSLLSAIAQEFNKSPYAFTPTCFRSKPAFYYASGVISS
jgi:hypothetical protein